MTSICQFCKVIAIAVAVTASSSMAMAACVVPNVGGTAELPATLSACDYVAAPGDMMQILPPALPAGDTIDIDPTLTLPFNISEVAGGGLGGNVQTYDAILEIPMQGTGTLAGFNRLLFVQVAVTTESAPRIPGDPVQTFATEMVNLDGQLFGDPDFDFLSISAGTGQGLPAAPGITQLTRLGPPGSDFQLDSFFDITYEIDFQGAPGSVLEGFGGVTQGTVRLQVKNPVPEPSSMIIALLGIVWVASSGRRNR